MEKSKDCVSFNWEESFSNSFGWRENKWRLIESNANLVDGWCRGNKVLCLFQLDGCKHDYIPIAYDWQSP